MAQDLSKLNQAKQNLLNSPYAADQRALQKAVEDAQQLVLQKGGIYLHGKFSQVEIDAINIDNPSAKAKFDGLYQTQGSQGKFTDQDGNYYGQLVQNSKEINPELSRPENDIVLIEKQPKKNVTAIRLWLKSSDQRDVSDIRGGTKDVVLTILLPPHEANDLTNQIRQNPVILEGILEKSYPNLFNALERHNQTFDKYLLVEATPNITASKPQYTISNIPVPPTVPVPNVVYQSSPTASSPIQPEANTNTPTTATSSQQTSSSPSPTVAVSASSQTVTSPSQVQTLNNVSTPTPTSPPTSLSSTSPTPNTNSAPSTLSSTQVTNNQTSNTPITSPQTQTPPLNPLIANPGKFIIYDPNTMYTPRLLSMGWLKLSVARHSSREALNQIPRAELYAMHGINQASLWNAMQIHTGQYRDQTGNWQTSQQQEQYQNLQELYAEQLRYSQDINTAQQAQQWLDVYDKNPTYIPFNENGPILQDNNGQVLSYEERLQQATYASTTINSSQEYGSVQERISAFQDQQTKLVNVLNQNNNLEIQNSTSGLPIMGTKNAINNLKNKLTPIKNARTGIKAAIGSRASNVLSLKTLGIAGGLVSGGLLYIGTQVASWLTNLAKNDPLKAAAIFTWLQIQIAQIIASIFSSAITIATTLLGGIGGFITLGPVGILPGAFLGYQTGQWLTAKFGGASSGLKTPIEGFHKTVSVNTQTGIINTHVAYSPAVAEGILAPAASFFMISIIGPFILTAFLTIFVTMTIFTSFTVPNPQATQWDPNFASPGTPGNPGTPIPPGGSSTIINASLSTIISNAAQAACLPTEMMVATMKTEAAGVLDYSDGTNGSINEIAKYSDRNWWRTAGCYTTSPSDSASCNRGYCYNTCAPAGLCAPGAEVRGAAQFEMKTFYGGSCADPDGEISQNNPNPSCMSGYSQNALKAQSLNSPPEVANRCILPDALNAMALKLAAGANISVGSCSGTPAPLTKKQICEAARAYCGNCGRIGGYGPYTGNTIPDEWEPCGEYYTNTTSVACGGFDPSATPNINNIGYCNKIYFLYSGTQPAN